ncbi:MAG TPA: hypothetical protein VEH00_04725 [Steroidobacteraceae bacterium]|nr:hypothetical protein [Steroidobacteraceae bacterium]
MTTAFLLRRRLIGITSALACGVALAQTASAVTLPKPPPPSPFYVACYYSFHLTDGDYGVGEYAEVVFAAGASLAGGCSSLNTTLGVSNIVGIAIGLGSPAVGPITLAGLAPGEAASLPENASVTVVNGVATLNSLELYLQGPGNNWALLQTEGYVNLELFSLDLQFTLGSMVPKNSWSEIVPASSPIPLLTNPPSGEFSQ